MIGYWKYHALGNDYLILEPESGAPALTAERVRLICDRRLGIGADGIMVMPPDHIFKHEHGVVESGPSREEDELMIAVSRLFLDNVPHIQSSWVKYGDEQGLKMLNCGADDFMGTILSEEITKRAGGQYGEFRSVADYVDMITAIGRTPVELQGLH